MQLPNRRTFIGFSGTTCLDFLTQNSLRSFVVVVVVVLLRLHRLTDRLKCCEGSITSASLSVCVSDAKAATYGHYGLSWGATYYWLLT